MLEFSFRSISAPALRAAATSAFAPAGGSFDIMGLQAEQGPCRPSGTRTEDAWHRRKETLFLAFTEREPTELKAMRKSRPAASISGTNWNHPGATDPRLQAGLGLTLDFQSTAMEDA